MKCRFCNTTLEHVFIDLINSPASNSFLKTEELNEPEVYYPLKVYTCHKCFLVQIDEYKKSDNIFNNEYVYFSSYSKSWLKHAELYCEMMVHRFSLDKNSKVVEIASNDGYLLQYFDKKGIPVLGIEPTSNTAEVAVNKGIETITEFFGTSLAKKLAAEDLKADVVLGNNVLAHVPDINDFVAAMKLILKPTGVITMEFPHLLQLVKNNQFDTIYHEHFSYLSFLSVKSIFAAQALTIFDVEQLTTHGGSLRIFAKHEDDKTHEISENVKHMEELERQNGMENIQYYLSFQQKAMEAKLSFLSFLCDQKRERKKVAAYGAAAKGNTLLNYCGVKNDLIEYVVDANPNKQNKFLPGSHIPVVSEQRLKDDQPDFIIIFPWNIKDEIIQQLEYVRGWKGKFVIPIPELQIL